MISEWSSSAPEEMSDEQGIAAQLDAHGLTAERMQSWLYEIANQPSFRQQMDEDCDMYDGNQLDSKILRAMEARGQAPIIENLIGPVIDVLCGMEAKTRRDAKVRPEPGELNTDVADALSLELHQEEVETRADKACSDAFKDQIGPGLGWVYVGRNTDPFGPKYKVERVHRREIFWDWRSKQDDISIDARYLIRKRRCDLDVAMTIFPEMAEKLTQMTGNYTLQSWDIPQKGQVLSREFGLDRSIGFEDYEWFNPTRKTVLLYEVWYQQMVQGEVIRIGHGRTVEFEPDNPVHQTAMLRGIWPEPAFFMRMRRAFWVAGHLVRDEPSPYKHRRFPYVRFIGFKEDRTGVPYGQIRRMRSPQEEVNARKTKMIWLMASVRAVVDQDAVDDHNRTRLELAKPVSYTILKSNRAPNSRFEVQDGAQLAMSQFQLYLEDKKTINQVAGVYQSMLGNSAEAKSGVAITSLVEQGTTTTAELMDNFLFSRTLVYELLLQLIIDDLSSKFDYTVTLEDDGNNRQVILNQRSVDPETGLPTILNDVSKVRVRTVLDEVPSTPTFRQQQFTQIVELTKSLPPATQALLIGYVIDASDLPKRKEMVEHLKQSGGTGAGEPDPNQQQALAAQQQMQIQQLQAAIDKLRSEAELNRARTYQIIEGAEAEPNAAPGEETGEHPMTPMMRPPT